MFSMAGCLGLTRRLVNDAAERGADSVVAITPGEYFLLIECESACPLFRRVDDGPVSYIERSFGDPLPEVIANPLSYSGETINLYLRAY
jgi:hypothetical protein